MVNAVICAHCLTYIESTYRHDYKMCECWFEDGFGDDRDRTTVSVDGGQDYVRRGFSEHSAWIEVNDWTWHTGGG